MTEPTAAHDLDGAILSALRAAPEPIAVSKVLAAFSGRKRPAAAEIELRLAALVAAGTVHRFAPYRTQKQAPRFWDRSHDDYARQVVVQALQSKTRSSADLEKAIEKPLADLTRPARREVLAKLTAAGAVFELPCLPGSKAVRYSVTPPDPADYLRAAVKRFLQHEEKVQRQLAPLGIGAEVVRAATRRLLGAENEAPAPASEIEATRPRNAAPAIELPPENAHDDALAIVEKIRELGRDPRLGGFISLADLRRSTSERFADPAQFDRVVLDLARRRRIDLYPHDYPASLPVEERNGLVVDERGVYFNGVSLR